MLKSSMALKSAMAQSQFSLLGPARVRQGGRSAITAAFTPGPNKAVQINPSCPGRSSGPFLRRQGCHEQHSRSRVAAPSAAASAADGGDSGAGSSGGGGGGDGGSSDGPGDEGGDQAEGGGLLAGWRERVAADPEFAFKVLVEQIIGVGASVIGDMSSRPNWGLNELDFVFSTLVVGSIMNFALMYLLAKTPARAVSASRGSGNLLQKLFDENTLKRLGAPGGNFFEPGFPLSKRFLNLGYKGVVFGLVGFSAGIIGTALSNGLLAVRKQLDPEFKLQNAAPAILPNAGVWGTHMAVSSNLRYQLLNGLDMVAQPVVHPVVFKIVSTLIRLVNNVVGGMSFVTLAKLLNVQNSGTDAAPPAKKPAQA